MRKREKKENGKIKNIIIIILLLVVLIIGGFYGTKFIYHQGVEDGRENFKAETEEKLTALGAAVLEKTEFLKLVAENLSEIPEEADEEGFNNYIGKLESLISKTENEKVKNELENFKNKFAEFLEFYKTSEDNDKISEKYNEIKIQANATAEKITEIFNEKIKAATEDLVRQP